MHTACTCAPLSQLLRAKCDLCRQYADHSRTVHLRPQLGSNAIRVIDGLRNVPTLTELHLGRNKIASLKGSGKVGSGKVGTSSSSAAANDNGGPTSATSSSVTSSSVTSVNATSTSAASISTSTSAGGGGGAGLSSGGGSSGHGSGRGSGGSGEGSGGGDDGGSNLCVGVDTDDGGRGSGGGDGLSSLRALKVLGLASNRLRSLEGIEPLHTLQELYADHNGITELAPLVPLTKLHTLDLGANQVSNLESCRELKLLEELWLPDNAIASLDDLAPINKHTRLQSLRLSGCPCAKQPGYRDAVRHAMPPSLQQLDADTFR